MPRATAIPAFTGIIAVLLVANQVDAAERRFTHVYETTTHAPGTVEYEQWVTWSTDKAIDSNFDRVDFRHELEFGLNDTTQLGLYLSDWRSQRGDSVDDGAKWRNVAVEVIHSLSDPITDAFGSAIYGEVKIGDELFELEGKLLLQQNVGKWVFGWNGTIEAEWEGERFDEDKGKLEQTIGGSYQFSPSLLVGFEAVHELEYEDWSRWGDHVVYLGPNVSYRNETWWVTATPLLQVTDVDSEADFQLRVLFGFDF